MAAKDITPDKQSVETCLKQKTYYIDFYQREYVWKKETVDVLLQDIFYAFEMSYEAHKDEEMSEKTLAEYNWYYLNVFITNNVDGKVYIVDGQQRLTTLTLIAAKLYHITDNENLKDTLKSCIFAKDKFKGNLFCIDHAKRNAVMESILTEKEYNAPFKNATEENLTGRYKDISQFIDAKKMDAHKVEAFIYYFLERLVLVELSIDKDDTPMVFEVINDRGEELKPFEILKGKLVGMISKSESDVYSAKWDEALSHVSGKQDAFFRDYLKAKFIYKNNSAIENAINGLYHRYIFETNDIADKLGFRRTDKKHIANIKRFISEDLPYYTTLYEKITSNPNIYLRYCNEINNFSSHYQNILAACSIDDKEEDAKIVSIAKETDRLWILMVLNRLYDSNEYQNYIYNLNSMLASAALPDYRSIYDTMIRQAICAKRNLEVSSNQTVSLLEYSYFLKNNYDTTSTPFKRYYLARIEEYICKQANLQMQNDVFYISTKTGKNSGYHIEHILSNNDENVSFFTTPEEFAEKRNMLGGLLLLKGLDNISSGNEPYKDKLKTYSHGLLLAHSLCDTFFHANKDFEAFNNRLQKDTGVMFKPYATFDRIALEERCKLIYEITKLVWEV